MTAHAHMVPAADQHNVAVMARRWMSISRLLLS
jgi:hypothetical protein